MGLERFNKTVDILVKAYLNDTLIHGQCTACAVGNIVADTCGYKFERYFSTMFDLPGMRWKHRGDTVAAQWSTVFCTYEEDDEQKIDESRYRDDAKEQIDSTGYTWYELARVEVVFEMTGRKYEGEEKMFQSLLAVVDVLAEIDNIDLSVAEETKKLFVK